MRPVLALAAATLSAALAGPATGQIAFFAGSGLPSAQGWTTLSIGNPGTEGIVNDTFQLDSTGPGVDTWGYSRISPVPLDAALGYTVNFSIRVPSETHSSANRAGFSMLFVGNDPTQSIELAFRMNEVFAYEYVAGAFVQGPLEGFGVSFTQHSYTLTVANGQYSLSAMGNVLISGNLQHYQSPLIPYAIPNFMFFGDNTSSGSAIAEVNFIDVVAVPEPRAALLLLAGLGVVALRARQARR
jgi:hypothetical protein